MLSALKTDKAQMPSADTALPGRDDAIAVAERNVVTGNPMVGPFPDNLEVAVFGMGCFGGPSACSGKRTASGPPLLAMPAAIPAIRHTAKFAAA